MPIRAMERMEMLYKDQTFSSKQGHSRKPQRIMPSVQYDLNSDSLTDRDLELLIIQHKIMKEFIFRMGINEGLNEFYETKISSGEFPSWFRKWN